MHLLSLFFKLIGIHDKGIRMTIYRCIVSMIARQNRNKGRDVSLNRQMQDWLFSRMSKSNEYGEGSNDFMTVKKSLSIVIDLFGKGIWKSAKIVNIIAKECVFHPSEPVRLMAIRFMLGHKGFQVNGTEEQRKMKALTRVSRVGKLKYNAKRAKKKGVQMGLIEEKLMEKDNLEGYELNENRNDTMAIASLWDANEFANKLFGQIKKGRGAWETRIFEMNLLSRVIAFHKLSIHPFYTYMQRYLKPYQRDVTRLIAIAGQGVHRLVPEEVVGPLIRKICDEFIGQHAGIESIAVGINGILCICRRQPLSMTSELLNELADFAKYKKDRGVQMAARGLIGFYRIENPILLANKQRGKYGSMLAGTDRPKIFGEETVLTDLRGADLLAEEDRLILDEDRIDAFLDSSEDDESHFSDNSPMNTHLPLMARRVLSEDDLSRLRELRVKNLMNIWRRKRDQVGLIEDRGHVSDEGIDSLDIESATVIRRRNREARKEQGLAMTRKQMTWDQYGQRNAKGSGGSTNKEKARRKSFRMTKRASKVLGKRNRSDQLRRRIHRAHVSGLRRQGKRIKLRRRM